MVWINSIQDDRFECSIKNSNIFTVRIWKITYDQISSSHSSSLSPSFSANFFKIENSRGWMKRVWCSERQMDSHTILLSQSITHSPTNYLTHSLTHFLIHSITPSLTYLLIHSLSHSFTPFLTHSLSLSSLTSFLSHCPTFPLSETGRQTDRHWLTLSAICIATWGHSTR